MTTTATQHDHPTPIRLPGQAAAHEGPVDMTMMYLAHHAFRRDLGTFAAAVPVTPVDDQATWRAMGERWAMFSTVLHHHHEGEDTWVWPFLMERADASGRAVLEAMEAEHAEIDPILAACAEGFDRLANHADADARAALAVRLVAARESLGRHLQHEETHAIALMQQVMTGAEWEELDRHFKEQLRLRDVFALVPWILLDVPETVRAELFQLPGGRGHRLLWWLTRGRFARRHARAFKHLAA